MTDYSAEQVQRFIDELLGKPTPCIHPWRHTVYGSSSGNNGTTCVLCGKRLR